MVRDAEDRFVAGRSLTTNEDEPRMFTIDTVRRHQGDYLLSLVDIGDKNAADALVGVQFVIDLADRRELEDGEWWAEDLIGRRVESVDGVVLGSVSDVVTGSAQDRLVVRGDDGSQFEVPFVDELVPTVKDDRIVVDLPDGLADV